MTEWYDVYNGLSSLEDVSIDSTTKLELPEIVSIPANNADEINFDEYYMYKGYDSNGRKIVKNDVVDSFDYYGGNYDNHPSQEPDEPNYAPPPPPLIQHARDIAATSSSYIGSTVVTDNTTQETNDAVPTMPKVNFIASQMEMMKDIEERLRAKAKPDSLHSKMASNPVFAELFEGGVTSVTVGQSDRRSRHSDTTQPKTNDIHFAATPKEYSLRQNTVFNTTSPSLSVVTEKPKKRTEEYVPPSDVNIWDDSPSLKTQSDDIEKEFERTKRDLAEKMTVVPSLSLPRVSGALEQAEEDGEDSGADSPFELDPQLKVTTQKKTSTTTTTTTTVTAANGRSVASASTTNTSSSYSYTTNMLTLNGVLSSKQANQALNSAGEAILFVKDIAVAQVSQYMARNVYISSFLGCVSESLYFVTDRARTASDLYMGALTADDPEKRHLTRIKNSTHWQNILLRYSMASLTWKQRQLLEETRDGGTLDQLDLNALMRDMGVRRSNERLMRIADEYFYITTATDFKVEGSGGSNSYSGSSKGVKQIALGGGGNMDGEEDDESEKPDVSNDIYDNKERNSAALQDDFESSSVMVNKQRVAPSNMEQQQQETVDALGSAVPSTVAMEFVQSNIHAWLQNEAEEGDEDAQYALAKFFTAPCFSEDKCCYVCSRSFGITLFRHHCRFCGQSVCETHSKDRRCIYRYGLIQPVRVCGRCCGNIDEIHRRDVLIWKESRVQAYLNGRLIPYFNPTVDRGIDKALRIADYSIVVAKNTLALNFPTKVVLETIDILKRYGLSGFAGLLLRQDFLESVETLKRISGMDAMFSMSLHELTACIYYKLAIDRGLRGCNPEGEKIAHTPHMSASSARGHSTAYGTHSINSYTTSIGSGSASAGSSGNAGSANKGGLNSDRNKESDGFPPLADDFDCSAASHADVDKAIRFAPLALKLVYELNPVDCQRLAKSQGWETLYTNAESHLEPEQPCYALFATELPVNRSQNGSGSNNSDGYMSSIRSTAHHGVNHHASHHAQKTAVPKTLLRREAVLAIRGTKTIQDVVTDIRAAPQEFPPPADEIASALNGDCRIDNTTLRTAGGKAATGKGTAVDHVTSDSEDDEGGAGGRKRQPSFTTDAEGSGAGSNSGKAQWEWLNVSHTSTYACGGFSRAAMNVLREVGPSLVALYNEGYEVTIVGHSLGGGVAALLTHMLRTAIPAIYCVAYGCPSCVDAVTADLLKAHVLSVVNHDDVISRITPQSIRMLMSELMQFREQVFKHLQQDWLDVMARAYSLWSPRWRQSHSRHDLLSPAAVASNSDVFKALKHHKHNKEVHSPAADHDESSMVVVDQEVLPDLWVPGRILHIYMHKGQYHAAEVSRTFPDLRRIEVQGNMFEDHRSKNMLDALLEVRAVRYALNSPPDWVPFNNAIVCFCCTNSFTWHSTFRGDAQEYRDRYNCKHCGNVVCGPCSVHRRAIPKYGLLFPERICDHCLYKGDFAVVR